MSSIPDTQPPDAAAGHRFVPADTDAAVLTPKSAGDTSAHASSIAGLTIDDGP